MREGTGNGIGTDVSPAGEDDVSADQGIYGLFADIIVMFHLLYVLFAVGGQVAIIAGWLLKCGFIRNVAFRAAHFTAVILVAAEAATNVSCPLTVWEYNLRHLAGQTLEKDISFVARLARMLLFFDLPEWSFRVLHIVFGAVVLMTFVLIPPRFRRKRV
jgi:hypothetical protein